MSMTLIRKRILLVALGVIIAAGLCTAGISAYFIAADAADNAARPGNSDITIQENFENPPIEPEGVTPITKKVEIKNTGINTSGVRVKAEFSSSDILDYTVVDYNTADWTQEGDWWYYNKPVKPGETTTPLFNQLTITDPGERARDFDVYVYAESRVCSDEDSLAVIKNQFVA